MKKCIFAPAIAALAWGLVGAHAASVHQVLPSELTGNQMVTFSDLGDVSGFALGKPFDSLLVSGGVSFGERFAGQANTTTAGSDWDRLSGAPNGPLSLAFGPSNQNLSVYSGGAVATGLSGLGPRGLTAEGLGEGAFAALFAVDQSEFGFDLLIGDGGSATIDFFRRDGNLIDQIVVSNLSPNQSFAFKHVSGAREIAGVSIFNDDPGGVVFDNLRFDAVTATAPPSPPPTLPPATGPAANSVPEPATWALAALALVAAARRRPSKR